MSNRDALAIAAVAALSSTRVGIRLEEPSGISVGRFYEGGPFVRWNPDALLIEDEFPHEQSQVDSLKRIAQAMKVEFGCGLRVTRATNWDGVTDATRAMICDALDWLSK